MRERQILEAVGDGLHTIPAMVARIAALLDLQPSQVNVKAKTAEKLGPVGQGEAIEARAVALLMAT